MLNEQRKLRDTGYLYDANEPKMIAERARAKDLCWEYNTQIRPSDSTRQLEVLNELLGSHGENTTVVAPFYCDYGYNIKTGDNFFANHNLTVLDCAMVSIGNNVFIANNVTLTTAGHPIDTERRNKGLEYAWPIRIGNNVWIGAGVLVLPGITIGSNVVIGSGAVVTRDIPDNVVAVGNPCRVMRSITEADKEKYLQPHPSCQQTFQL